MSYIFQSRQLHPRACSLGMGFVGPDQPWSRENAGKAITEANKSCPVGNEVYSLSEFATPKRIEAGKAVVNEECFKTGKIFEAKNAGNPRLVQWCCPPKKMFLPKRTLTREEMEQYGGQCGLMRDATSGEYKPEPGQKVPTWRDPNSYIGSSCENLNIRDNGYALYCCPWNSLGVVVDHVTGEKKITVGVNTNIAPVSLDPAVLQQHDEARQQELARRESIIQQSSVPEGTFFERYGFPLLLIAGTVGIGVTAALFKRFSVASKQAKDAKAAAEAVKKNPDEWWPPQSVGERWYGPSLRSGSELDIVPLGDDFFEVYFKNHVGGKRRYLGNIHDEGIGRWRYRAKSPHGHEGTHQNINDAATWLARRSWRVIKGER